MNIFAKIHKSSREISLITKSHKHPSKTTNNIIHYYLTNYINAIAVGTGYPTMASEIDDIRLKAQQERAFTGIRNSINRLAIGRRSVSVNFQIAMDFTKE